MGSETMDGWTITIFGEDGAGKTALAIRFTLSCFVESYDPLGEDNYRKHFMLDNRTCLLNIIDTAGQEFPNKWVREGQGFLLVYSVASRSTFDRLEIFHEPLKRVKGEDAIYILVGNKSEVENERQVSEEEGAARARQWGCQFLEVSAKTGENVDQAFMDLVRALRAAREPAPDAKEPAPAKSQERYQCRPSCIIL
ncbi:P-loop containing nucleoside triphosphate hydrolase protein [Mycena galopus ATCC 62051]|nr:P-loop containing nucleoside triphosphate hydrolase protein [Mycena galopus ATCC 62051]